MFYEGCTIDEIRAYRESESEVFDFGEGEMKMDGWYGSEDAYYEMCLPEESGTNLEMDEYYCTKPRLKKRHKYRLHKYYRKQIGKKKLEKLSKVGWWIVSDKGTHKTRCYYSGRKTTIKKISNKKVRKYKNLGNYANYRKVYDYWYELF